MVLGITACMFLQVSQGWSQNITRMDSVRTDSFFQMYEFHIDIPVGQTFVNSGQCHSYHSVKFHHPDNKSRTNLTLDTLGRSLRAHISMMSANTSSYASVVSNSSGGQVVMRGSMSTNEDPGKYLTELRPAINAPVVLSMRLGVGSAWLDLSDIRVRGLDIESSDADVFISYKRPNMEKMQIMNIYSGMSKVVVRNLEYARAEKVHIQNGMGETKIIIGEKTYNATHLQVGVGAGSCVMMVHQDVPMKLILKNSFLSTVDIPDEFMKSGENSYVNLAYKKNPSKAVTAVIDLGIGSYSLITYE